MIYPTGVLATPRGLQARNFEIKFHSMTAESNRNGALQPAPTGFEYFTLLLATIATAAEHFDVSERAIRNWLNAGAPAIFRDGKPPLVDLPMLERWVESKRRYSPDFGQHGGCRW